VATISRLLKIIGLFCRTSFLLQGSFAKETYNLRSLLIVATPYTLSQLMFGIGRGDGIAPPHPPPKGKDTEPVVYWQLEQGICVCVCVCVSMGVSVGVGVGVGVCVGVGLGVGVGVAVRARVHLCVDVSICNAPSPPFACNLCGVAP